MNNTPCHIELISRNLERSTRFYQSLFGWVIIDSGIDNYRLIKFAQDFPVGGAIIKSNEKLICEKQWPLVYIRVDSLEETLMKAQDLGANIITEIRNIPNRGDWAVFADPYGNQIALWKEDTHRRGENNANN